MTDPCSILFLLLVVLAIVAVAGHGLWLLAAALFRAMAGESPPAGERPATCDGCGLSYPSRAVRCPHCGLHRTSAEARELRELAAAARRIQTFRELDLLDPETCERVYRCIEERQRVLLRGPAPQPTRQTPPAQPRAPVVAAEPVLEAIAVPDPPAVTALPEPVLVSPPATLASPREEPARVRLSLAELLAGFMEQRNILWGELVGGLLIVGCSVALVISLWRTLAQFPYFPFVIFATVTLLLFGAGLYTLSRWKLETTSRGLLAIGTLLVPLNFLVLAGLAHQHAGGVTAVAVETAALVVLGLLVQRAACVLVGPALGFGPSGAGWLTTVVVLAASGSQLLVPRLLAEAEPAAWGVILLGGGPVVCYGLVLGVVLAGLGRSERMDQRQARSLFAFLGLTTFALAVALGFLLHWGDDIALALQRLAVPITVAAVPILLSGVLVYRKLGPAAPAAFGVTGAGVALAGALLLFVAIGLAWPVPVALAVVGALGCVTFTAVALGYRLSAAHGPALLCLVPGYLILWHLLRGTLALSDADAGQLVGLALSPESGVGLVILALLLAAGAEGLVRLGRWTDGVYHAAGGGVAALLSLALVMSSSLDAPGRAAVVCGVCGAGSLVVNSRWRQALLTYAGSGVLLAALLFALRGTFPGWNAAEVGLVGLLAHATGVLITGQVLHSLVGGLESVYTVPCRRWALVSSLLAVLPLLLTVRWDWLVPCCLCASWLAGIWLVLSWVERRPGLFAAFQAALTAAVVLGVTAWLAGQSWVENASARLSDPWSLQAYALGLGGLGLLWAATRIGLRSLATARVLLELPWPAVDRVVLGSLVVGQLALAVGGIMPGVIAELTPAGTLTGIPDEAHATGPGAWAVLGLLAVVLVATFWHRVTWRSIAGLVLLAVTVPVLAAAPFRKELAVASSLRWGLAACLLVCSAPLWLKSVPSLALARTARRVLVAATVTPVLVLTAVVAVLGFTGQSLSGPSASSFFASVGWVASQVVPLAAVSVALSGHGVGERSPVYLFAAGLVAVVSLAGGYALAVVLGGGTLNEVKTVRMVQLATAGAGLWGLGWLLSRRWLEAWRETPGSPYARPLMLGQLGIALTGCWLLVTAAVGGLVFRPAGAGLDAEGVGYAAAPGWVLEAGSALGWMGLLLTAGAVVLRARRPLRPLPALVVDWGGLAILGLLACTVERFGSGWGYRCFLVGWAGWTLVCALRVPGGVAKEEAPTRVAAVALWGALIIAVGLKAAAGHGDHLWAAGGIGLAGLAWAVMAVRRRSEDWAFAAGASVNLAASLLVWAWNLGTPLTAWWVVLVEVNLAVLAGVALVWLALRRQVYGTAALTPNKSPYLGTQVVVGLLGNAALLAVPLAWLLLRPAGPLPPFVVQAGEPAGWLALLLTLAAAFRYARHALPAAGVHAAGAGGVLLSVLAACAAVSWDRGGWLPHHLLTLVWTGAALVILTAGWAGATQSRIGPGLWEPERRERAAALLASLFPVGPARRWVEILGLLVVALALRGAWNDPARPYWSAAVTLAVSVLLGALAVWSCRPVYVYASGLLFSVIGYLAWQAWLVDRVGIRSWLPWGPGILDVFFYTEVLCLAVASVVWSAVELPLLRRTPPVSCRGRFLPFTHGAALLALHLLAVLVLGGLASDLTATNLRVATPLGWLAVIGVSSALLLLLRDPDASAWGLPAPALYAAGALAVGLTLHAAVLPPTVLLMRAPLAVAGYALLTTVIGWRFARSGWSRPEDWPAGWLLAAQTLAAALVVPLTVGTAVGAEGLADRLTAPLAVALLLPAGVLLVARNTDLPRYATLGAGVLALVEVGWALLDPGLPAPWLHRSVMLLVAVALAGFVCGTVLLRVLAAATAWAACIRRTAVALGGLTCVLLAVVMVQELLQYDPEARTTPLAWPAKLVLALTLLGILVHLLHRALTPGRDLLRLSEKGRTAYVYAAEVTLVLLLVHIRLSVPDWIPPIIGQYWTLVVMGIAFAGVGLSEWFRRRALPVLAEPLQRTGLFLPVLPLAAFLTRSLAEYREAVGQVVPGMQPFFRILERLPGHYGMHALVWFLLGLLYTLVAVTRRSTPFALLAALAVNFGLWVVFASQEPLSFFLHPQLWLIPLALILLAAGQLNRQRLTAAQGAAVRYLGVLLIYVASTADLFIAGLGHSFLMPVILAGLCVVGVLAGILLRVRAFLFLGVAFLVLVIFTQIWHAAVDLAQTWVWWACGMALGAAILTLFGLFEKRRNDVLRVVQEIRGWQ